MALYLTPRAYLLGLDRLCQRIIKFKHDLMSSTLITKVNDTDNEARHTNLCSIAQVDSIHQKTIKRPNKMQSKREKRLQKVNSQRRRKQQKQV